MKLLLPYPDKALWPNGRPHWAVKHRATKRARQNAAWLAKASGASKLSLPVEITITVFPQARGPLPDADNTTAASKALLDGVSDAMGVNDRDFPAPRVVFAPERTGHFEIEVRAV